VVVDVLEVVEVVVLVVVVVVLKVVGTELFADVEAPLRLEETLLDVEVEELPASIVEISAPLLVLAEIASFRIGLETSFLAEEIAGTLSDDSVSTFDATVALAL